MSSQRVVCRVCEAWLCFSARRRGDGLCGPCSREQPPEPKTGTAVVTWNGERKLYPIDLSRDPLAELEAWRFEHKAHTASIECEDGYGAGGWGVSLGGVHVPTLGVSWGLITAVEWTGPDDEVGNEDYVYACVGGPDDDDWAGLGPTILAAVDHARRIEKGELT